MVVNNTLSLTMSLLAAFQHVGESWIYQESESLLIRFVERPLLMMMMTMMMVMAMMITIKVGFIQNPR